MYGTLWGILLTPEVVIDPTTFRESDSSPGAGRSNWLYFQPYRPAPMKVVEAKCPFCGGTIMVQVEEYAVLHTIPVCSKYFDLEPLEFLEAVNEENRKGLN